MDEIDVSQERDFKSRKPGLMKKCSHCGMYSQTEGKCPFCGKGIIR